MNEGLLRVGSVSSWPSDAAGRSTKFIAIVGRHARTAAVAVMHFLAASAEVKFQGRPVVRWENRRRLLWVGSPSSRSLEAAAGQAPRAVLAQPPARSPTSGSFRGSAAIRQCGRRLAAFSRGCRSTAEPERQHPVWFGLPPRTGTAESLCVAQRSTPPNQSSALGRFGSPVVQQARTEL